MSKKCQDWRFAFRGCQDSGGGHNVHSSAGNHAGNQADHKRVGPFFSMPLETHQPKKSSRNHRWTQMDTDKTQENGEFTGTLMAGRSGSDSSAYSCHQFSCPVVFRCPKSVFICVHLWFSCSCNSTAVFRFKSEITNAKGC